MLFELSKINFAEIDFDLIGDLYEHYLNLEDRKDKGQYYTPHFIVELILNRIGFNIHKTREIEKKMRSEEHTSELQSHSFISYAVFCLKKKKKQNKKQKKKTKTSHTALPHPDSSSSSSEAYCNAT